MTLTEIAEITGGEVVGDRSVTVSGFTIDSRAAGDGVAFVAVRAERDGHAFVADAFERGAAAALVDREGAAGLASSGPMVVVADTVAALTQLAAAARARLGDAPVVAITGSTGKTSTKDLAAGALASLGVVASPNSFNNELGVPLTLLATSPATGAVVVEIGARGPGQIAQLALVVRHRVGVVTTVGAAHTELFGAVADVARAKAELLETLPPDGVAVVGIDHDHADVLLARSAAPAVTVGSTAEADVRWSDVHTDADLRPTFRLETPWGSAPVTLLMRGAHQAGNAALAVTAAVSAGLSFDAAVEGVASAVGSRWRMEVERTAGGVVIVNDAYNANPASMTAALDALAAIEVPGRRIAVLGPMAELGALGMAAHDAAGRRAAALGIDRIVVVGPPVSDAREEDPGLAGALAEGARSAGADVVVAAGVDEAVALLRGEIANGDAVLVKASRVAGLEQVAAALLGEGGA